MSDWRPGCEALFEAGRAAEGEPTAADRERVARRMAVQLAGGAAITAASGALRAASAGGSLSKGGFALAAPKIVGALALGVVAVGGVAVVTAKPPAEIRPPIAAPMASLAPSSTTARPAPALPRVEASPAAPVERRPRGVATVPKVTPAPVAVTVDAPRSPPSPTPPEAAPHPHDTGGELRLVRAADDALGRGDYAGATKALDEHDALFGTGHFGEECAAARVLAVCGAEGGETGRQAACGFASRYPHSPMNERVSAACGARCK